MKFRWNHGLIFLAIDIVYERKKISVKNCILDTGSATTAIDINLVEFNYSKNSTIRRLFGIGGGSQEVVAQKINKIIIDRNELPNIKIEFGDIHEELGIQGFIGNDVLRQFKVVIDYSKKEIQLL